MTKAKPTVAKIRRGLYRIVGLTCGGDRVYGPCGGELHTERCKADGEPISHDPEFRWETFCTECSTCDCNGWPTLADCLANAAEYFAVPKKAQVPHA